MEYVPISYRVHLLDDYSMEMVWSYDSYIEPKQNDIIKMEIEGNKFFVVAARMYEAVENPTIVCFGKVTRPKFLDEKKIDEQDR